MAIDSINIICKEGKQFEERLKNNKFYFTVKKGSVVGSSFEKLKPRFNISGLDHYKKGDMLIMVGQVTQWKTF